MRTDTPLQALILFNGEQFVEAARALGQRLHEDAHGDAARMIELGFLRCLSRQPDAKESEIAGRLYREQQANFAAHPGRGEAIAEGWPGTARPEDSAGRSCRRHVLAASAVELRWVRGEAVELKMRGDYWIQRKNR